MNAYISSRSLGLIFVHPFDFSTCEWMVVLSPGSSNAALLGDADLTNRSYEFSDNPSADAMACLVGGLVDPSEVGEGNAARTIDCTSDLLSSVGLPLVCFVQVASFIVSLMLLTMQSLVGSGDNPALADSRRTSLSGTRERRSHACCGGDRSGWNSASFNLFLMKHLHAVTVLADLLLPWLLMLKQSSGM